MTQEPSARAGWRSEVERYRAGVEFEAELRDRRFRFASTWGLFSPREVDVAPDADCLDLGCGYGPIGLVLASLAPGGQTVMLDRDFVAVDYATRNAEANGIANARVLLSNGFEQVPPEARFDLVATNLPAKVGNEMTSILFVDTFDRLRPGGQFVLVTLSGMRRYVQRTLEEVFGNYEKVRQGRQYTVHRATRG